MIEDERAIASWYISKIDHCSSKGIHFELCLLSFINMAKSQKCYYTGLPLNKSTRTIDRIDNNIGYVRGNVVACHKSFNNLKSVVENPTCELTLEAVTRGFNKWSKE